MSISSHHAIVINHLKPKETRSKNIVFDLSDISSNMYNRHISITN